MYGWNYWGNLSSSGQLHNLHTNCLNYASVINEGTSVSHYVGGIMSYGKYATIENCVSSGKVTSGNKGGTKYVGGIIGSTWKNNYVTITHSYWTSDTTCTNYYGSSYSTIRGSGYEYFASLTNDDSNTLNTYAYNKNWNNWAYNQNNVTVNFILYENEEEKGFSYSSQLIMIPEVVRRGYSFLFWCVNENSADNCNIKYDRTLTPSFTSETTLYAQWVVNKCTVPLDVNGGDKLSEQIIVSAFDTVYGNLLPIPTRRGYKFIGWFNKDNEETPNKLVTKESLINDECNCSTLYAEWIPDNFTVTFNVNGGVELENNTKEVTFDSKYGELPTPNRSGFEFGGWFTNENESITNETVVNITNDCTLYANWTALKFIVTLDVNGGDALPGYDDGIKVPSDKAYDYLPEPTRRGYTFTWWYTESNESITNDTETTAIVTKDQTLHAEWIPNNYTVSFDVNKGDELIGYEDGITVTFDANYSCLPMPTRTGYSFAEWLDGNNEVITNRAIVNITNDCIFHANWTANIYTISFDVCGGEELSNITVTFDSNYSCLPTPMKEGYTFLWWYIKGTKEFIYNTTVVKSACNHTLCAVWNKNSIIFDVNGGDELGGGGKMEVTYNEVYGLLPTPTRRGYTFCGWFNEDNEEVKNDTKVEIVSEQTLHAEWIPSNYTMILDANGGELNEKNITVTYDGIYGSIPEPSRTGYTFIGWYTENNEIVTINTIVTDACHCTLHANWTANTYIIIFDVNGGDELSEDEKNIAVAYDGTYDSLPEPIRTGYTFDGWFNEDGEEIMEGTKVAIANNQTFYAHWKEIVTVTPSEYVEIVFGKKGLTEEEIERIIGGFTDVKFEIVKVEGNKMGETRVIIKFADVEKAEEFFRILNEMSDSAKDFIRSTNFNSGVDTSISAVECPFMLFSILMM